VVSNSRVMSTMNDLICDHLYANETQLLSSFSSVDFSYNIAQLENTITNVSNWMPSDFLSLCPSKTEFLISVLSQ